MTGSLRRDSRLRFIANGLATSALACACSSAAPRGNPDDHGGPRYDVLETTPSTSAEASRQARADHRIKTVFIIVLENHAWASIKGGASAPYLNAILSEGAHAEAYRSPREVHPSEPNYIWLEAGDNLSVWNDDDPRAIHRTTRAHLTRQLDTAEIPWTAYQEDIIGDACPSRPSLATCRGTTRWSTSTT